MALLLETLYGDIVIDLDVEGSPELCKNVIKLAYCRYYTNTLIFNVTAQRFCQLGCPIGDGTGGACIYGLIDAARKQQETSSFDYKLSEHRFLKSVGRTLTPLECQEKGRVVATLMNSTPDTIGSQFLITTASGSDHALDGYSHNTRGNATAMNHDSIGRHSQFLSLGRVVEDEHNVIEKINAAYTDPNGRPYADIRIIRALVVYDPFVDEVIPGIDLLLQSRGVILDSTTANRGVLDSTNRRVIQSPSPDRPSEEIVSKRISAADVTIDGEDEDMYVDDEKYEQERIRQRRMDEEETAKKVDHSRAVVLEMIGDLPDANIRAPENVLFICKLNPITIDEDLELIFSRFDESVKVEIIRDIDTGSSLQYAFAEFTTEQAAAEAYFKMNNALIDDRRIKVDFSQSVAKLWDRYHQKMKMPTYRHTTDHRNDHGNGRKRTTGVANDMKKHMSEQYNGSGQKQHSNNQSYRRDVSSDKHSTFRSDDDRHRKRDRDVDIRVDKKTESREKDRERRERNENSEKYDDRGRHHVGHSNENVRHSHRRSEEQLNDEIDNKSHHEHRRRKSRHNKDHESDEESHHEQVQSRSRHNKVRSSRYAADEGSIDASDEHRHHKKSHRSRNNDVDDESDRHHRRHHKHKKKHNRERDRDGSSTKHHRRSRSESR